MHINERFLVKEACNLRGKLRLAAMKKELKIITKTTLRCICHEL